MKADLLGSHIIKKHRYISQRKPLEVCLVLLGVLLTRYQVQDLLDLPCFASGIALGAILFTSEFNAGIKLKIEQLHSKHTIQADQSFSQSV
jgi:hypothetical protein